MSKRTVNDRVVCCVLLKSKLTGNDRVVSCVLLFSLLFSLARLFRRLCRLCLFASTELSAVQHCQSENMTFCNAMYCGIEFI